MLIDWLNEHLLPCSIKALTGYDCPGCGVQRALIALLRGNIEASLRLYPALIFQLSTFVFTFLHLIFKFKHGAQTIKLLFIGTTIVILLSYAIKMYLGVSHF